jgi:hypothetical protein
MKKKGNYTITANKEAGVFDCAARRKKNLRPSYISLSLSF